MKIEKRTIRRMLFWLGVVCFVFLWAGKTPWLAMEVQSCSPRDFIGTVRYYIQGDRFLTEQRNAITAELAQVAAAYEQYDPQKIIVRQQQVDSMLAKGMAQMNQKLDEFYQKNPSMAPTLEEKNAEKLREQADLLEEIGAAKQAQQALAHKYATLQSCLGKIEKRLAQ